MLQIYKVKCTVLGSDQQSGCKVLIGSDRQNQIILLLLVTQDT